MGSDILVVVEELRLTWKANGALNANCIALIPKCSNIETLNDFQPIFLCNIAYKIRLQDYCKNNETGAF